MNSSGDNPYIVHLAPDEFHELLSGYETFLQWCDADLTPEQRERTGRVLKLFQEADVQHVCLDEHYPVVSITCQDLKDAGCTDAQISSLTDDDMRAIASRLEDMLRDDEFFENIFIAITMVMEWGNPGGQQ